ncbi:Ribosomal RNA small subunit methyltransferase D [Candidatus Bealeia paramacronuclearis]|uniref:Ribosomal RNA small subunit methyltransferase D n=1 Tax=Candidatus Bealeia paramacronuclearis TaxID=1921001 RepID=A0ABZ2C0A6_9PROT|nr:Ribosomal RNA small subunit methyltransferase D [Candidatus Bealeia paramacronuclearis]
MRVVGGTLRGKKLIAPESLQARPTSDRLRETLFNILAHNPEMGRLPGPNTRVLDAFAGTGALGLEALSRGALEVTFVDYNSDLVRNNVLQCHMDKKATIISGDFLKTPLKGSFDLIFLDPPYGQGLIESALSHLISAHVVTEKTILVLEFQKDEKIEIPDLFEIIAERNVSISNVLFLKMSEFR